MTTTIDGQRILSWITRARRSGATELVVAVSGALDRVETFATAERADEALAEEIVATIGEDAGAQTSDRLTYRLSAHRPGEATGFSRLLVPVITREPSTTPAATTNEAGSLLKDFGLQLREMHALLLQSRKGQAEEWAQLFGVLREANGALQEEAREHRASRLEMMTLREKQLSQEEYRENLRQQRLIEERKQDWLEEKLNVYLPVILGRMRDSQGNRQPMPPTVSDSLMRALFKTIDLDTIHRLADSGVLSPEQFIAVGELHHVFMEREEQLARARERKTVLNGSTAEAAYPSTPDPQPELELELDVGLPAGARQQVQVLLQGGSAEECEKLAREMRAHGFRLAERHLRARIQRIRTNGNGAPS